MKYIKLFEDYSYDNTSDLDDFYLSEYELVTDVDYIDDITNKINESIDIFKSHINIFEKINIRLVKYLDTYDDDGLGMYSHESAVSGNPYILLNYSNILEEYNNGYDFDTIIKTTIYHELGHAMVDIDDAYLLLPNGNIFKFNDEEDFVEDFAYNLFNFDKIDSIFKKFVKIYKEKLMNNELEISDYYS